MCHLQLNGIINVYNAMYCESGFKPFLNRNNSVKYVNDYSFSGNKKKYKNMINYVMPISSGCFSKEHKHNRYRKKAINIFYFLFFDWVRTAQFQLPFFFAFTVWTEYYFNTFRYSLSGNSTLSSCSVGKMKMLNLLSCFIFAWN